MRHATVCRVVLAPFFILSLFRGHIQLSFLPDLLQERTKLLFESGLEAKQVFKSDSKQYTGNKKNV